MFSFCIHNQYEDSVSSRMICASSSNASLFVSMSSSHSSWGTPSLKYSFISVTYISRRSCIARAVVLVCFGIYFPSCEAAAHVAITSRHSLRVGLPSRYSHSPLDCSQIPHLYSCLMLLINDGGRSNAPILLESSTR